MTEFEINIMMLEAENLLQEAYQEFLDELAGMQQLAPATTPGAPAQAPAPPATQEGGYAQPGSTQ